MNVAVMVALKLLAGATGAAEVVLVIRPHSIVNASIVGQPTIRHAAANFTPVALTEGFEYEPVD